MLEIDDVALNGVYGTQKNVGVVTSLKKWSASVTDEFSSENPDTPKEIVQFVHEVRPVCAVTLSSLLHMLRGWNDDTMPSFDIFRVHFVVIFNFTVI